MRVLWAAVLVAASVVPQLANAETVTYQYDAQGRLIRIVHAGAVNNGVSTGYTFDKAGNRVNVKTTGAPS